MTETVPKVSGHELYPEEVPLCEGVVTCWESIAEHSGVEAVIGTPLFIHISGASGSGKLTVIKKLDAYWADSDLSVQKPKSATTRQYRNEDDHTQYLLLRYEDGQDIGAAAAYEKFMDLVSKGLIREFDVVPSKEGPQAYGTLLSEGDLSHPGVTLLETTVASLPNIKQGIPAEGQLEPPPQLSNLIAFYLLPPGETLPEMLSTLARWMERRPGESPESVYSRLWSEDAVTPHELAEVCFGVHDIDYLIVNHEQKAQEPSIAFNAIKIIVDRHLRQKKLITGR